MTCTCLIYNTYVLEYKKYCLVKHIGKVKLRTGWARVRTHQTGGSCFWRDQEVEKISGKLINL